MARQTGESYSPAPPVKTEGVLADPGMDAAISSLSEPSEVNAENSEAKKGLKTAYEIAEARTGGKIDLNLEPTPFTDYSLLMPKKIAVLTGEPVAVENTEPAAPAIGNDALNPSSTEADADTIPTAELNPTARAAVAELGSAGLGLTSPRAEKVRARAEARAKRMQNKAKNILNKAEERRNEGLDRANRIQARADAKANRKARRQAWMNKALGKAGEVVDSAKNKAEKAAKLTAKAAKGAGKIALATVSATAGFAAAGVKEAYDVGSDIVSGARDAVASGAERIGEAKQGVHDKLGRRAHKKAEKLAVRAQENYNKGTTNNNQVSVMRRFETDDK